MRGAASAESTEVDEDRLPLFERQLSEEVGQTGLVVDGHLVHEDADGRCDELEDVRWMTRSYS